MKEGVFLNWRGVRFVFWREYTSAVEVLVDLASQFLTVNYAF